MPLSNKWNTALRAAKDTDFDYILILGSDDLINAKTLKSYSDTIKEGYNYLGITDMYVLNSENKELIYHKGYILNRKGESLGAGRLIHKSLIERVQYSLWRVGINKTLDGSMSAILNEVAEIKEKTLSCSDDNVFLLDIKSSTNIWSFQTYKEKVSFPVENTVLADNLHTEVVTLLNNL